MRQLQLVALVISWLLCLNTYCYSGGQSDAKVQEAQQSELGREEVAAADKQTSPQTRFEYVGHCPLKGEARAVAIYQNLALVALNAQGLGIVNISNPDKPRLIRYLEDGWWPLYLTISGNICFIADRFKGIGILDITQPESPKEIKTFAVPGIANYVVERGDLLFVACGAEGLLVARKDPKFRINVLSQFAEVDYTKMMLLKENLVFLADNHYRGFKILDISYPTSPSLVAAYDIRGYCDVLARQGDLIFIGHRRWGVMIADISQVSKPKVISKILKPDNVLKDMQVQGNLLFTADSHNGVHLYDISNPASPQLLDEYDTDGQALRLTIVNDIVYVADWDNGLVILRLKGRNKSHG